jgi:hypothetical protein
MDSTWFLVSSHLGALVSTFEFVPIGTVAPSFFLEKFLDLNKTWSYTKKVQLPIRKGIESKKREKKKRKTHKKR